MGVIAGLVFDIGLHKGEDTAFYLKKGFNVVAVEANPILAEYCKNRFSTAIGQGRLVIVNAGIADREGTMPFYINHYSSEWSSFDKAIGTRNNTSYEVVEVPCVRAKDLFKKHGTPFYMKVDIEGYDFLAINDIPDGDDKPPFVSCEAIRVEWLDTLHQKGYRRFKLINQANDFHSFNLARESNHLYVLYRKFKNGVRHRLGSIIPEKYETGSSGPFGEESKGSWKSYEEIRRAYVDFYQGDQKTPRNNITWLDFHAAI